MCVFLPVGAIFGDPSGNKRNKVILPISQARLLDVERRNDTAEKLARALLSLLFTPTELAKGNCTKPVREDINELDSERLWAIKCKNKINLNACISSYHLNRSCGLPVSRWN